MSIEGFADGVLEGFGVGGQGAGVGMNLNHWQDAVWAEGSWVPESWGGVETPATTAGGSSRRRRRRRRFSDEDLVRQSIVNARQISQAPKEAMAVALRSLDVPPQSDVAMSTTAEVARLIRRVQRKKEQEEEALMMILLEIE